MSFNCYVLSTITKEVKLKRGYNAWLSMAYIIKEKLAKLQPDKPEDDIYGFIAYEVSGKARMKMKTGRFLTRKLGLNNGFLNDTSLRRIADTINNEINPDCNYRLDTGVQIIENYKNSIGGSSCMSGYDAQKTGMYAENPDRYQQVIMIKDSDTARAIVVKLDNGFYLMDRIYSTCDFLIDKMQAIAKKNKWYYRNKNSDRIYDWIGDFSVNSYSDFVVSDLNYTDGELPYQDTLTQYSLANSKISLFHNRQNSCADGILDSTDGYIEKNLCTCYNCENIFKEEETIYVEFNDNAYCNSCYTELFYFCGKCNDLISVDDLVCIEGIAENWCENCANDAVNCENCGSLFVEKYQVVEDYVYCDSCVDDVCCSCVNCKDLFLEVNGYGLCENCEIKRIEDGGKVKTLDAVGQGTFFETQ